jgi:hypothetical protein
MAVLFGTLLAIPHLRGTRAAPWPVGVLHALIGLAGLACLMLALQGPPRGLDQGTGSFGAIAAISIVAAAIVGATAFYRYRIKRTAVGTLIGVHATLAVSGFVILAVYVFS